MTRPGRYLACLLPALLMALCLNPAAAQTQRTEHTYKLDDPETRPAATLEDAAWLIGSWRGEAFGGTFEQTWSPPSGGSMLGTFKTLNSDEVGFYELLLLVEEEGSLSLKVKHFSPEFVAWEEKDEYIDFRFIRAEESAIHFSGLSFYRISDDTMLGYVAMRDGDEIREEKLSYRRRP